MSIYDSGGDGVQASKFGERRRLNLGGTKSYEYIYEKWNRFEVRKGLNLSTRIYHGALEISGQSDAPVVGKLRDG